MSKFYCPSCSSEVIVTRPSYSGEVIVTCNTCLINARGFNDKVLKLFHNESEMVKVDCRINFVKSFTESQDKIALHSAFEAGRWAAKDEDLNWTQMNLAAMGMV